MGDELLVVTVTRAGGADDDGEHGPEVWLFYCDWVMLVRGRGDGGTEIKIVTGIWSRD